MIGSFLLLKVFKKFRSLYSGEVESSPCTRDYSIGWEEIGRCQRLARLKLLEGERDVQHEGIGGVQTESQNAIRRHYGAVIIRGVVRRSEIARNVSGTMSKMSIIRGSLCLRILKHFGIDTSSILLAHPFKFYSPSLIVPFRIYGQSSRRVKKIRVFVFEKLYRKVKIKILNRIRFIR